MTTPGSGSRFRTRLRSAANAICARSLPKQKSSKHQPRVQNHHTYPRLEAPRGQAATSDVFELVSDGESKEAVNQFKSISVFGIEHSEATPEQDNETISELKFLNCVSGGQKLKGKMAREVVEAWSGRVGAASRAAPADRVQALFNDLHLYPTKTQVFEMLVCARQCARRTSLGLSFGEFCVFAAELRRAARRKQLSSKSDSYGKLLSPEPRKEIAEGARNGQAAKNGREASPPPYEVFLGGSCNPTTWRSDIAIPMLEKMGITYFNPQVANWSHELMEVEHRAKQCARALLFVLDAETRAAAASVEAAHLAAGGRDLLLVLRPYRRHQRIGSERITDQEYVELSRARATLQEAVERRGLPVFADVAAAVKCARAVLRGARTDPRAAVASRIIKLKHAFDAADAEGRGYVSGAAALAAVRQASGAPVAPALLAELARAASGPGDETRLDFETFCSVVAELTADAALDDANAPSPAATTNGSPGPMPPCTEPLASAETGRVRSKQEKRKLSIFIPKLNVTSNGVSPTGVLTPHTARRLEQLPSMLGAGDGFTSDVYLGGSCPTRSCWREKIVIPILEENNLTYIVPPKLNDYNRMFSVPPHTPVDNAFNFEARSNVPPARASALDEQETENRLAPASPAYRRQESRPRSGSDGTLRQYNARDGDQARVPLKHERSPPAEGDQPEKRPKMVRGESSGAEEEVEIRHKSVCAVGRSESGNRLSASDFYKVPENASPQPFKGMYDDAQLWGARVLLFGITRDTRCVAPMCLAAHYMGLRPNHTVLCVQLMDKQEGLSEVAVKDYNRGRHYLIDLARREGIPVFDKLEDAVACVLSKLRQ